MIRAFSVALAVVFGYAVTAAQKQSPRIWDDAALADWATPVAGLNVRPSHYSSAEYYAVPGENLKTYPVYPPDKEPPGYWEWLQQQKPEPIVDVKQIRSTEDWIEAGERAFHDLGSLVVRTKDPALIAQARDASVFQGVLTLSDGGVVGPRWVVTPDGVMLTSRACAACHQDHRDGNQRRGASLPAARPGMPL